MLCINHLQERELVLNALRSKFSATKKLKRYSLTSPQQATASPMFLRPAAVRSLIHASTVALLARSRSLTDLQPSECTLKMADVDSGAGA